MTDELEVTELGAPAVDGVAKKAVGKKPKRVYIPDGKKRTAKEKRIHKLQQRLEDLSLHVNTNPKAKGLMARLKTRIEKYQSLLDIN